jgi:hypothetical protein
MIEPGYAFTREGVTFLASEDIGPLTTRRKSGERNQNVFNHLVFWSEVLAQGADDISIPCGEQVMVIAKVFATGEARFGIPSDGEGLDDLAMAEDELEIGLEDLQDEADEESRE